MRAAIDCASISSHMEKIAFYRKYRPQGFTFLVGQDHVRQTLLNALRENKLVHAYLFSGPRGTGKTSTARLIAKALDCMKPNEQMEPCNECEMCTAINEGRLIDLIEIDAASNRGIDDIRDLIGKINFVPTRAKNKIYILDEVHMLSKEAFNALLKTLEEPPPYVYFILATTEPHKIPETIISRCQRFDFKRIDPKTIMARLSYIAQLENIEAEDKAIEAIAKNSEGGLRDAIGLMEQLVVDNKLTYARVTEMLGLSGEEGIMEFYDMLVKKDAAAALKYAQNLYKEGFDLSQFIREFLGILREKLLEAAENKDEEVINRLLYVTDVFQDALDKLKNASIPQLPLEIAVLKICGFKIDAKMPIHGAVAEEPPRAETRPVIQPKVEEKPVMGNEPVGDFTMENVQSAWPRITERLKNPNLKLGIRSAKLDSVADNTVTLEFATKFYMDEVLKTTNTAELEKAFLDMFNKRIRIKGTLRKIELEPVINENVPPPASSGVDSIADFFGGEILE